MNMKRSVAALLTALLLAIAVQALFVLAAGWAEGLRTMLWPREVRGESLDLLKDGTPVVQTTVLRNGTWHRTYRTIDGAALGRTAETQNSGRASYLIRPPSARETVRPLPRFQRIHGFWVDMAGPVGFGENWYAISDSSGLTTFVGYDVQSRRIVGHVGRNGFVEAPPPPDDRYRLAPWFLSSSQSINMYYQAVEPWSNRAVARTVMLPLPDQVVEINFLKKTVEQVWKGIGAIDVCNFYDQRLTEEGESGIAIRTPSHLHLLARDRRVKFSLEIPEALRDKMLFVYDVRADGATLLASSPQVPSIGYFAKLSVGKPPKVVEVPLDNPLPYERPSWPAIGATVPQPSCLVAGWLAQTHQMADEDRAPSWGSALASEWPLFWPTLLVVTCVSALLAAAAWRRQRRYGLGQEALWAGFVLLFGVPGWLAYRWHRAWPPLEACPSCGAIAPRDREACLRCKAAFPPPKRESFEIRD
jgi:hypothetical protein